MTTPLTLEMIQKAPKALLHDHLDGGLRPATVVDLAEKFGYDGLPTTDVDGLAEFFRTAAHSGSLVRYLEPFAHTVGVMQTPEALHRVALECVEDLAADSVVYAEIRFAPELHIDGGLSLDASQPQSASTRTRNAWPAGSGPLTGSPVTTTSDRPDARPSGLHAVQRQNGWPTGSAYTRKSGPSWGSRVAPIASAAFSASSMSSTMTSMWNCCGRSGSGHCGSRRSGTR